VQLNAVRREIANLEHIGVIVQVEASEAYHDEETGTERSKFYQLQTEFILFNELKALLTKGQLLEEQAFIEEIKKRAGQIKLLLLTGLFMNEAKTGTDILLVGELKTQALAKVIKDFEKKIGQPIRYTLMDDKEFTERREIGDVFLYTLFESKHTTVVDAYQLN
jgi:23S rRNA C2498 (ribose-2'-O)-methylase RlmM